MRKNIVKILGEITDVFDRSKVKLPLELKLRVAKLILGLMGNKKHFGLFIILGWQNKWNKYTDISDSGQDIFARHHISLFKGRTYDEIASTINFDGAILINKIGEIIHSGVILEGLRPKIIAAKINPGKFKDLSEQFGFRYKVHSRHLFAIAASYVFKNTVVFTVSEEIGSLHIFESGKIIYSTENN